MATTSYCTTEEVRSASNLTDSLDDGYLDAAVAAASRRIDSYCGRYFYQDDAATARVYAPDPLDLWNVTTDDISTTDGLIVKTGSDGTYGTTLTGYELSPLNGIGPNGALGWPYRSIRLISSNYTYPVYPGRRYTVQVTATWGWAAIPDDVRMACRLLAQRIYRSKDVPFGATGFDAGVIVARGNPLVAEMLDPYRVADAFAGIA